MYVCVCVCERERERKRERGRKNEKDTLDYKDLVDICDTHTHKGKKREKEIMSFVHIWNMAPHILF